MTDPDQAFARATLLQLKGMLYECSQERQTLIKEKVQTLRDAVDDKTEEGEFAKIMFCLEAMIDL